MSTVNGIGTILYDWKYSKKRTKAEATTWFVILLLPIFPIRRERLRLKRPKPQDHGWGSKFFSFFGFGTAFDTEIYVERQVPLEAWGVVRTYLKGWVLVPLLFLLPGLLGVLAMVLIQPLTGMTDQKFGEALAPVMGFGMLAWWVFLIAALLDRSKGR